MKNKNTSFLKFLFASILVLSGIVRLQAAGGDFAAWDVTTNGHGGMDAGVVNFSEKDMTVELWLYIDDTDNTRNVDGTNILSNRHNGDHGFSINLSKNNASSNIDVRFYFKYVNEEGTGPGGGFPVFLPRAGFSNQWAHLAFVISSTEKKAYAYLNGELYETVDIVYDWLGNRTNDKLNLANWYTNPKFYGKMADIRVWNKARSAQEIAENYNVPIEKGETLPLINYTFGVFGSSIPNDGNSGKNSGTLLPSASWNSYHKQEILAQKPFSFTITDDEVTWQADGENWDVQVISNVDNSILKERNVTDKSFLLNELTGEYTIRIRTQNNGFYSAWATVTDEIKVGCIGDSNTYGAGASNRSLYSWPAQLGGMLGEKYTTTNLGVSGALMMKGLNDSWTNKTAYAENKALNPEIMIIALGTNDSKDNYWNATNFKNDYIELINEFKTYQANPEIYLLVPIVAYGNSWQINNNTINEQIRPIMREIAQETGLALIDGYTATLNMENLVPDKIHPNDEGLRIIAEKIADVMLAEKPEIVVNGTPTGDAYAQYSWYKDNTLISGANEATYTATETGTYKVAVKLNAAWDDIILSEPVEVSNVNTVLAVKNNVTTSVNTTKHAEIAVTALSDYVKIDNGTGAVFSMYGIDGQLLNTMTITNETEFVPTSSLANGLYVCKVQKGNTIVTAKILK